AGLEAGGGGEVLDADAAPGRAEQRPAGDTMHVELEVGLGLREQAGPVELEGTLDLAVDLEAEVGDAGRTRGAAHRAQRLERALAGREARAAVGEGHRAGLAGEPVAERVEHAAADRGDHRARGGA